MSSREQILNRIRQVKATKKFALPAEPEWVEEALAPITKSLLETFKEELEKVSGECVLVASEDELVHALETFINKAGISTLACLDNTLSPYFNSEILSSDLLSAQASVTRCESLIARTGSAFVSAAIAKSRRIQIFPPTLMLIASEEQLVPYLSDAIAILQTKYGDDIPSQISLITGPSRTADIEKTLVLGAHGPKAFVVFIVQK